MTPAAPAASAHTAWHVALLRGVNVGGNTKVPMAALKRIAADLGFTDAITLLNSGNLVYRTFGVAPQQAATLLRVAIATELQVDTAVFVRTRDQQATILAENPFQAEAATEPSRLLVTVWDDDTTPAQRALFAEAPVVRERFVVGDHALYLWLPDGISASVVYEKTARALGDHITARNWSTMQKLLALMPRGEAA
jgi:uncharacterized protein (DUF1697 family)